MVSTSMLSRGAGRTRALGSAVAVGMAASAGLAGCGLTDIPTPPRTVTVYVDPPTQAATRAPTQTPSRTTSKAAAPTEVPTRLAAGQRRGAPDSFDDAVRRIDAASVDRGISSSFQSPSGNIGCRTVEEPEPRAACEVRQGRIDPPLPTICPSGGPGDIGRIELTRAGAFPRCNSDSIRKSPSPTLEYGRRTSRSLEPLACLSEEVGMTCVDTSTRHGFFLARGSFVTF